MSREEKIKLIIENIAMVSSELTEREINLFATLLYEVMDRIEKEGEEDKIIDINERLKESD